MKRAIVIGSHSFVDGGSHVGSQYLAQSLATTGWQVDYVATASSIFDIWGKKRHARLRRVWTQSQDTQGVRISPGLTEWAFKTPFPAVKLFLRWRWQLSAYSWCVPRKFRNTAYDLCITEVTPNMLYIPWVRATTKVLRLSDWPPGFAHDLHPLVINQMEAGLVNASYDETWAVSRPLTDYARKLNSKNKVLFLPNGVEDVFLHVPSLHPRRSNSAVYIGGVGPWFDIDLLRQTALQLPHWRFDLYGTGTLDLYDLPPNIKGHGSIERKYVPELLARYEVGLIPFVDTDHRMAYVERPLKFYEYIAAGLGVASTDLGALRSGMGELAAYGNSVIGFAEAIVEAQQQGKQRPPGFGAEFVREHAWSNVIAQVKNRLRVLCENIPKIEN